MALEVWLFLSNLVEIWPGKGLSSLDVWGQYQFQPKASPGFLFWGSVYMRRGSGTCHGAVRIASLGAFVEEMYKAE